MLKDDTETIDKMIPFERALYDWFDTNLVAIADLEPEMDDHQPYHTIKLNFKDLKELTFAGWSGWELPGYFNLYLNKVIDLSYMKLDVFAIFFQQVEYFLECEDMEAEWPAEFVTKMNEIDARFPNS